MKIPCSIEVNCTPDLLWTYLEDPEKLKSWMKGLEAVERETDGPPGVGSAARLFIREGGRVGEYRSVLTAREPVRHLALDMTGKNLGKSVMKVDYRLADLAGRTRLDYVCQAEFPGLAMKLMGLIGGAFMKMQVRIFFRTLKGLAEAEARDTVQAPSVS